MLGLTPLSNHVPNPVQVCEAPWLLDDDQFVSYNPSLSQDYAEKPFEEVSDPPIQRPS